MNEDTIVLNLAKAAFAYSMYQIFQFNINRQYVCLSSMDYPTETNCNVENPIAKRYLGSKFGN